MLETPQTTRPTERTDSYASGIRIPHSSPLHGAAHAGRIGSANQQPSLSGQKRRKNTAPSQSYIHVQASTTTLNKNTGIQSAITNGTPVPPPQVRTTPLDGGGLRSNRRPTDGSPSPAPAAATTTPSTGG